jgi:pyruvate,water dikinase
MSAPALEPAAPQVIPIPPHFPVQWNSPHEQRFFWTQDRMHFPDICTPIDAAVMEPIHNESFNQPFAAMGMPVRMHARAINGRMYMAMAPTMTSPEEMHAAEAGVQEKMSARVADLDRQWREESLPELQRHLEQWATFDLQGAGTAELLAHLDDTVTRMLRCWAIHFFTVFPAFVSISLFDELYRDIFGTESEFGSYKLLQGMLNKSVEAGEALWKLSRRVLMLPEVHTVLAEEAADDIVSALERSRSGRAFLAEFQAYLLEYGQRGDKYLLSTPSWLEDPRPAIRMLQDYCRRMEPDPEQERATLAAEREQLIAQARRQLQGYPQQVVGQFEFFLKAAQVGNQLHEDHNFWIDQRVMYRVRQVFMEFGRRFVAAAVLAEANDVFLLTLPEIRATAAVLPALQQQQTVVARKTELARLATLQAPPALGSLPPGPPPDNPLARAMGKFFGAPPRPSDDANVLYGHAGSPGVIRGPVRMLRSLTEAGKLQQGDVLVAETTAPPWTPLFATAAAVVTDTGGILSHCAVVAREYRIPAVVGVGSATATLHDGQMVEVDGDAGLVRILSAS